MASITVFFYKQYQERELISEKYSCKSIYKYTYKIIFVYHNTFENLIVPAKLVTSSILKNSRVTSPSTE